MSKKSWLVSVAALVAAAALGAAVALVATNDDDESEPTTVAVPTAVAAPDAAITTRERQSEPPPPVAVEADDVALGRAEAARVSKAALAIAGGGTITDIGRSDDPGEAYEVEVQTSAGEVDIALDDKLERVPNRSYDDHDHDHDDGYDHYDHDGD